MTNTNILKILENKDIKLRNYAAACFKEWDGGITGLRKIPFSNNEKMTYNPFCHIGDSDFEDSTRQTFWTDDLEPKQIEKYKKFIKEIYTS